MYPPNTSIIGNSQTDPTRRQFLTAAATGLTLLYGGSAYSQTTTRASDSKLAAFDELMTAFMHDRQPPGAALAVTHHSRLVYARGFGYADVEKKDPVRPDSLFRIASISKPFTSAAVLHLIEKGGLKLDDPVLPILHLEPHLETGASLDPRWHNITVRHCLQHTGGWDRGKSFDPMSAETAEEVARALGAPLPINATQIIRYSMGKPLDTDPGSAFAYSNFGYCVLGRVVEAVSGKTYAQYVIDEVLTPLGIRDMRQGKNLFKDRAAQEVTYYDSHRRTGRAISGPDIGRRAPLPYGVECIETMDANGGWIASAVDLVRFASALDDPKKCPILSAASIDAMLAAPPGAVGHSAGGQPRREYYACGWFTRSNAGQTGKNPKWHSGMLAGSSTFLECCDDGVNWAAVFNSDAGRDDRQFAGLIRPLMNQASSRITDWPADDLFRS